MIDYERVVARSLDHVCNLAAFRCGSDQIDKWVRKSCMVMHERYRSRVTTFHIHDDINPIGFYSLRLALEKDGEVRKAFDPRPWATNSQFSVAHLEFLGVHEDYQGHGLGTFMLMDVIDKFCTIAELTGVPALTLDPLKTDLVAYYEKRSFSRYGTKGRMLLTASTARELQSRSIERSEASNDINDAAAADRGSEIVIS